MTTKQIAEAARQSEDYIKLLFDKSGYYEEADKADPPPEKVIDVLMNEILSNKYDFLEYGQKIGKIIMEILEILDEYKGKATGVEKHNTGETKRNPGFVYIMHVKDTQYYKIGMTKDLASRESQLKTGNHRLACIAATMATNPRALESLIHRLYAENNVGGEFFEFNQDEMHQIIAAFGFNLVIEGNAREVFGGAA